MKNPINTAVKARLVSKGSLEIKLSGISMAPLLASGDIAIISPCDKAIPGNLYLFELPDGSLGVHRCVEMSCHKICMKGDNCSRIETISPERLLGKVTAIFIEGASKRIDLRPKLVKTRFIAFLSRESGKRIPQTGSNSSRTPKERACSRLLHFLDLRTRSYWVR